MGCGHSKINIYPKKSRNKNNCKKIVTQDKEETEEEENVDNETETNEGLEDCDPRKTIKVKPVGGPLLAQTEISSSQQNFFKMLDEKIENGPDYDSASETEKAAEAARLSALLKDWETASAGSRSLPATPKRRLRPAEKVRNDGGVRSADVMPRSMADRGYGNQIPQNVIHQSYGVAQQVPYRQQAVYNPAYLSHSQTPLHAAYPSALQYQAISPMYTSQPTYQPPQRQYPPPPSYNQHVVNPVKSYNSNNSPIHIPYEQQIAYNNSPSHKLYGPPVAVVPKPMVPTFSNGELIQQQLYHQMQYQQVKEYQHYKQTRDQVLMQQQQSYATTRNYQSTVHIPVMQTQQNDVSPLHRKQFELT